MLTHCRLLEMHNKSVVSAIGITLSVGCWFLWNLTLSSIYKNNVIYDVKGGFLHRFGQSATWWLVLILVVSSCVTFELAVASIRCAYWTTDVSAVTPGIGPANHRNRRTYSVNMKRIVNFESGLRKQHLPNFSKGGTGVATGVAREAALIYFEKVKFKSC